MMIKYIIIVLVATTTTCRVGCLQDQQTDILRFSKTPPNRVVFVNTKGATVSCDAEGLTKPTTNWTFVDGTPVNSVAGLRDVSSNGDLVFHSFRPERYRPDVHSGVYVCVASNAVGVLRSADVNVHGVVLQNYDVQVYDTYATEGNSAIFKCHLPTVLKEHVKVIAWIKNDNLLIQKTIENAPNEKYTVMPFGELLVRDVEMSESGSKYKCKTIHSLTGDTKLSTNAGQLFVTAAHGSSSPQIVNTFESMTAKITGTAILPCVAQGNPVPTTRWYKKSTNGQLTSIDIGTRITQLNSALLIHSTDKNDKGTYICEASNDMGKEQMAITLNVIEPLSVHIEPVSKNARMHNKVTFQCQVSGNQANVVTWLHNGVADKRGNGHILTIDDIQMSDHGIYQCVVKTENEMIQASAQLQLLEIPPYFVESFEEVTKQPGHDIEMKCSSSGIPAPSISWNLDGEELRSNLKVDIRTTMDNQGQPLSVLKLKKTVVEDGGLYTCVSSNTAGTVEYSKRININGPLGSRKTNKNKLGISGNSIMLNCPVYGHPISKVTWEKGGKKLPFNMNQLPFKNGTLKIYSIHKSSDSGIYKCAASNELGQHAEGQINLEVMVPPKIVPFEFQDELLREGMRARLQCVVSEGDLPLNVTWLKDGKPLSPELGVLVRVLDEFSSILTISSITPGHNGKYICVAANRAATITHTAELSVNVPPKVIPFGFLDDQFYKGMRAHVTCAISQGDLPITFRWLKDGEAIPPELGVVSRKYDDHTDSLSIDNVSSGHSGNYSCVVRNRAGMATWTAQLSVRVKPNIVPFHFGDLLYEGSPARIVCGLQEGDTPIRFSWLHDGVPVVTGDSIRVYNVDGLSSILSFERLSASNTGTYTCISENGAGVAHHDALLKVNVPPKIVPFSFQDDQLVEGQLARVSCVVSRGDLPLKLLWEKDGKGISSTGEMGIQIRSFDEHSSILSIASVSPEHNGHYVCIASNGAGSARHSAQLVVQVPPHWIIQPSDMAVVKGSDVLLHCQASGYPKPEVMWMQSKDVSDPSLIKEIVNQQNFHIFSNGSLLIQVIDARNEGFYFCKITNGIGNGLSAVVELKINAPPHFKQTLKLWNVGISDDAQLQCLVQGDVPMTIAWYKAEKIIEENQSRYKIQTTNTASDAVSLLTISKVTKDDNGMYTCLAENKYGKNSTLLELVVRGFPNAPTEVKVTSYDSRTVELIWKSANDGNDPIKKYIIQYKESHDSWDAAVSMETVNGQPTNSIVSHLKPATSYLFRIFAENAQGRSPASEIQRVTTNGDVPSAPPTNVQVESINTETFKVSWKAPEEKHWNGQILGFYVGYKEVDTEDPYLLKTLMTPDPRSEITSIQIGGLKQFTKYSVIVRAYNGQGKGPQSEPVVVMTSEGAPNLAPTDVRCTILTSQSVHVTWTAPPSDSINGILRGYKVLYKPASDWFEDLAENYNITLSTSLTLNNLDKFSNYSIQVLATTKAGDGPKTNLIFCKTLDDVPGPPVDIKAIATSDDSVVVAWKTPESPNGVIRSYSIYWKGSGEGKNAVVRTVPAHEHSYEVTGLKKGKRYDFWITAITVAGEGATSRVVTQSPSGPTVPAKMVSFDEKIITPWKSDISLLCQSVGLPEPLKKWTWKDQMISGLSKVSISEEGTLSIKDIQEEDAGDYTCQAQNDFGVDKVTYSIIVLAPPASPILEVVSLSSNAIEVQWKTPASKMSRIKGYTLQTRKDVGEWNEITLGADVRSYRINSLECGTKYEIYMSAFNKIGIGAPSEILIVSTNGSVPIPPAKSDLIEETSSSVSLYLNTWKSNGCPIHYYVVEYTQKSTNEWTFVSNTIKPEQRRLVIPNLKTGTWYELRMTAHNSAGSSVAEYNFATLRANGATIPPDLMSDATGNSVESLISYLNFYVIVPITCTIVILLIILAAACFYVKTRDRGSDSVPIQDNRLSTTSTQLRRGNSSESFSYMQRGTLNRMAGHSKHDDDPAPYATFQLANKGRPESFGYRGGIPPPLPPPNVDGFHGDASAPMNSQFFPPPPPNLLPGQGVPMAETTFIFPNLSNENAPHAANNFSAGYPHEALKMRFN